jgi:predicted regulator of Ras-like GTPase activity (Roadblock/LC7/MglB family)
MITGPSIPMSPVISGPAKETPSISFSLKAVLQNLPAFQLTGDIAAVSDDARITLPLALIEPQLASGRVSIAPDVFQPALPEEHRGLFQVDVAKTPVALPLEEVLKNLPATVLKLRDDQEGIAPAPDFETPFLAKAREDAKRFTPKPADKDAGKKEPAAESKVEIAPDVKPVIEKADPKEIVAQVNALSGVKACAITFSDGLSLAGELPKEIKADGLCAMAPSMLERTAQHVRGTKLGQLVAMTLYASDSAVSFFTKGNVCLTALHEGSLAPESRTRLAELVEKLSKTYAQPESSNVDH